jgi:arginyl-tRNA synthetase
MLNTTFDLYEGERTSFEYIPEIFKILEDKKLIYVSEGATVMDVKEETDKKEMPPVILRKSDGAYLYATTDLATIYERVTKYHPEEIVYITDLRQELHFEQVFRAAIKSGIAKDTKLSHYGFGTMNGPDGKPFKTREGGVMGLHDLINLIYDECYKRINDDIVEPDKKEDTAMKIALAALKYADLVPFRETDYIFDLNKFTSLDGKTGPYLLYSTIRIRSLLNKAKENNIVFDSIKEVDSKEREIILTLFNLPSVIIKAYNSKSLSDIADYIYKLNSVYNSFYADTKIISLDNKDLRESYLYLSNIVYETNMLLLNLMGIDCPEKM